MVQSVLRELICSCRGRNICASNCVCGTYSLLYTEICPCQGDDKCQNELNKTLVEDIEESKEVLFKILFHQGNSFRVSSECTCDTMYSENCMCESN